MDKKQKFLKIYANLPLGIRHEIILVINNEPITWEVAFIEVSNDTALSEQILNKLESLQII